MAMAKQVVSPLSVGYIIHHIPYQFQAKIPQYQVFKEVSNLWGFSSIFPSILDCPKTW